MDTSKLDQLKELLTSGQFHHATLWEGLYIYKRSDTGFRGFEVAITFNARLDKDLLSQAEEIVQVFRWDPTVLDNL